MPQKQDVDYDAMSDETLMARVQAAVRYTSGQRRADERELQLAAFMALFHGRPLTRYEAREMLEP